MPALRSLTIRATYGRSNDAALADFLAFVSVHLMQLTRLAVHSAFGAPSAGAVLTHLNACETLPALRELVLPENEGTLPLLRHSALRAESLALQWYRSLGNLPPAALTCLTELNGAAEWLDENAPILASLTRFKKLEVTQCVIHVSLGEESALQVLLSFSPFIFYFRPTTTQRTNASRAEPPA